MLRVGTLKLIHGISAYFYEKFVPAGYTVEAQLAEIAFGEWEGLTYSEVMARDKHIVAERESDKWGFMPPGGESYAQVTVRIRQWYATVDKDTVVAAHGGIYTIVAHVRDKLGNQATVRRLVSVR